MIIEIFIGVCVAFTIVSTLALYFALRVYIKVEAMEKSTHSVQYVPIDEQFKTESEAQVKDINKKFKDYVEEDFSDIIDENVY